ncbi:helix-turn-helix domain-containing protein [Faecalibaculum rodentium]|uniref:helix-turn-helix domain-containing protein n=1 Tax=Faecalibaculum rodentium TaxID=1702221 RepID=UPI0023F382BB|nr:type II toxin-antitoxin system MqsA family antitoxin [Faecalibaculum rodentium]
MFDIEALKKMPVCKNEFTNTEEITTNSFAKALRQKLGLSQRMMAKMLGLSEKTIEKWEQGANPIKGAASRTLYLLDRHPELVSELYQFRKSAVTEPKRKDEARECHKIRAYALDCYDIGKWESEENSWQSRPSAIDVYVPVETVDSARNQAVFLQA